MLAEEHLKKSELAQTLNQPDKMRWEQELVTELQTRNATITKQLTELKAQQTKFEAARGANAAAPAASGTSSKSEPLNPDESAYFMKLNEKLLELDREIAAATDMSQIYILQLQTNSTSENVQKVSSLLEGNRRAVQLLHREETDMELRKLEFWANRPRKP